MGKKSRKKRKIAVEQTQPAVRKAIRRSSSNNYNNHNSSNPLLDQQRAFLHTLSRDEREGFFADSSSMDPSRRAEIWMRQATVGEKLVSKYSWATPDERALTILRHFGKIVEIGCGANAYWCLAMREAGVDVVGYDARPSEEGGKKCGLSSPPPEQQQQEEEQRIVPFQVQKGGPEVLSSDEIRSSGRTLFLCYPDEDDEYNDTTDAEGNVLSLGAACLENYHGDYVIHVGEVYGDTLSLDQAPWGRSSSPEFQQRLAAEYHCLLKATLTSWLHVRDTISVWKRSSLCPIVFETEDGSSSSEVDEEDSVDYKHIPPDERLPTDLAAPCLAHLL